jgi:hypothetical protein
MRLCANNYEAEEIFLAMLVFTQLLLRDVDAIKAIGRKLNRNTAVDF